MVNKPNAPDEAFIARWIRGELSEAEDKNLKRWLAANPDEAEAFADMRRVWDGYGDIRLPRGSSREERWLRIAEKAGLSSAKLARTAPSQGRSQDASARGRLSRTWRAVRFAAAAVILLGVVSYWLTSGPETLTARRGERMNITLPDGSTVSLNAESSLQFRSSEWQEARVVVLWGEAFFDVAATGVPFTVATDQAVVEVSGASFNVRARGGQVDVACTSGSVRVRGRNKAGSVVLNPGFASRVLADGAPAAPFAIDVALATGWRNGRISFANLALTEVFAEIARQFDIDIEIRAAITGLSFTGVIDTTDLDHTLALVCQSSGLKYEKSNETAVVIFE